MIVSSDCISTSADDTVAFKIASALNIIITFRFIIEFSMAIAFDVVINTLNTLSSSLKTWTLLPVTMVGWTIFFSYL